MAAKLCHTTNLARRSFFGHSLVCCPTYGMPQSFNRPLVHFFMPKPAKITAANFLAELSSFIAVEFMVWQSLAVIQTDPKYHSF
jgi:hypothetical protein